MINSTLNNQYAMKAFPNAGKMSTGDDAKVYICRIGDTVSILSEPVNLSRGGIEEIGIKLDHLPEIFAELSRLYQSYKNQDQVDLSSVFDATTKVNTVSLL